MAENIFDIEKMSGKTVWIKEMVLMVVNFEKVSKEPVRIGKIDRKIIKYEKMA